MPAPTALSGIFTDWGGFEQFVAELHRTGSVSVEHDVTLIGRSGAPRQIDVLVRHKEGLYEHLIVVECKHRKSAIKRLHVDAMATTIREVGASRGVIFSTRGFQRGAIDQAAHENIGLFKVRPLEDDEWGRPGRHIDLWLQTVELSVGGLTMPGSMRAGPEPTGPLALAIDTTPAGHSSETPLQIPGQPRTTFEALLIETARRTAREIYKPVIFDFGGGEEGEILHKFQVRIRPEKPAEVATMGTVLLFPEIGYELGLRIRQSRMQIDRGGDYAFVLAVEDCVANTVTIASRAESEAHTRFTERAQEPETGEPYRNGSIGVLWLSAFLPASVFDGVAVSSGPGMELRLDTLGG